MWQHKTEETDAKNSRVRRLAWTIKPPIQPNEPIPLMNFKPPVKNKKQSLWSEIGIVGFKTVVDSDANFFRRTMWCLVLSTCFALMLLQTHDRLTYFMDRPVSTSVRYIRNDSLMFPSITICPYRDTLTKDVTHMDPNKLRELYTAHYPNESSTDLVQIMYHLADVYDVKTLWDKAGWDLEAEIETCMQGRSDCRTVGRLERIYTILGSCLHYAGSQVTISGQFFGFNIKLCKQQRNNTFLGRFYLMVSDRYSSHSIRALTHGFYLEHGWNKDLAVSLKRFDAENKQQAPCSSDIKKTVSHCISLCFHETLIRATGCRMPYMNLKELDDVVYCNTSQSLQLAEDMQRELLWEGRGWHPSMCQCGQTTCLQYLYEASSDTYARQDDCAQYKVFFTDMTYEETHEEFAYDIISLLCDIGGTLGLLLGASVLTVIQIFDNMWRQFAVWWRRPSCINGRDNTLARIIPPIVRPHQRHF